MADGRRENPNGALWHPFADMGAVAGGSFVIDRADGCRVFDDEGRVGSQELADIGRAIVQGLDAIAPQVLAPALAGGTRS